MKYETTPPARIRIFPAKEAPYVVVLRRKPSKVFHLIRWNTISDAFEYGSWFRGKLYWDVCDVSFDGNWMVYHAIGSSGDSWSALSQLPWLTAIAQGSENSPAIGGGYWISADELVTYEWNPGCIGSPFKKVDPAADFLSDRLQHSNGYLFPRLLRDGWTRIQDSFKPSNTGFYSWILHDEWTVRSPDNSYTLRLIYSKSGLSDPETIQFTIDEYPSVLDNKVDWATFDSVANLIVSRAGVLFKFRGDDIKSGNPSFIKDLEELVMPDEGATKQSTKQR